MDYRIEGEAHSLTMSKDEFLTLVSLLYEGLENLKGRASGKNGLAAEKHESAEAFVNELSRWIMTGKSARSTS